jgi:CO dehydrogenase/acetyl-CoA synthase beta subunit
MDFATLAVLAGGGRQTQGVMGIGRDYLLSRKFISADGGFKRVLWMSADLKQSLSPQLRVVCEREGDPGLLEKIADGESVNSVQDLMTWLQAKAHPALEMAPAM